MREPANYPLRSHFCSIRGNLEDHSHILTDKLATRSGLLIELVGLDSVAFWNIQRQCRALHVEIRKCKEEIAEHRSSHRC